MIAVISIGALLTWLTILLLRIPKSGISILLVWLIVAPIAINLVSDPYSNPVLPQLGGVERRAEARVDGAYFTREPELRARDILEPTRLLFASFLVVFLLQVLSRRNFIRLDGPEKWMAGFAILAILSGFLVSHRPTFGVRVAVDSFMVPFVAYFITRRLISSHLRFERILRAICFLGFSVVIIAVVERILVPFYFYRLRGPFANRDVFFVVLVVAFFSALSLLKISGERNGGGRLSYSVRVMIWTIIGLAPLLVLLTWTRANWLAFVLATIVYFSIGWRIQSRSWKVRFAGFLFVGIAIATILFVGSLPEEVVEERIGNVPNIYARLGSWVIAMEGFMKSPVFGIGLNNLRDLLAERAVLFGGTRNLTTVHNSFLSILVELGSVGFLFFILMIWNLFKVSARLFRDGQSDAQRWVGCAAAALVTAYFVPSFFSLTLYLQAPSHMYFYVLMGATAGYAYATRPATQEVRVRSWSAARRPAFQSVKGEGAFRV